jgi:iron complex transport system ATP-binding protein
MLKAEHLTVRYGEKTVLGDLSLEVREGEWWVVVGPNGAGKTTLAGALGKTVACEGSITLAGKDIREISPQEYARKVGVLSQNHSAVYGFTVEEVVSLGRYARHTGLLRKGDPEGPGKIDEALNLTGLADMRKRNMLTLSGGEQQRVFLAQVLCQDPEILILDEPANHLDLPFQQELFTLIGEWLKTPGRAIITVMHDLSLARKYGTHALLLDKGRCAGQGKASEVLTPDALQSVYGMDIYGWIRDLLNTWNE